MLVETSVCWICVAQVSSFFGNVIRSWIIDKGRTQGKQQARCFTIHRRGHGKEIACSSPVRFARYFPRDVYFYRRWAACTSVVNASIWKFASDADRKIKERLTYSSALNINKRKPFVVARNFRVRTPAEASEELQRATRKLHKTGEIARNEARRKCDGKARGK